MSWESNYKLAKAFYEHYGHCNIPIKFTTTNGIDFDPNGVKLGSWLEVQGRTIRDIEAGKPTYRSISKERIELLEEIKAPVSIKNEKWFYIFNLVKKHIDTYGKLPHFTFKTFDGVNYDQDGIILDRWVRYQRTNLKKDISSFSQEQLDALQSINFVESTYITWEKYYELAKSYYNHHTHLKIPHNFRTFNGYEYNPNGHKLGIWISKQREELNGWDLIQSESANKDKIDGKYRKLEEISMIWSVQVNSAEIEQIFREYGIYSFAKKFGPLKVFHRYPAAELKAKLDFLCAKTLPVLTDGKFHEIFFMSRENIKAKYGISIEEMIKNKDKNK